MNPWRARAACLHALCSRRGTVVMSIPLGPILPVVPLKRILLSLCFRGLTCKNHSPASWCRDMSTKCCVQHTWHGACHRVSPECVTSVSLTSSKASPSMSLICHFLMFCSSRQCVRAINTPSERETGFHCLSLKGSDSGGMLFCALRNFDKHTC